MYEVHERTNSLSCMKQACQLTVEEHDFRIHKCIPMLTTATVATQLLLLLGAYMKHFVILYCIHSAFSCIRTLYSAESYLHSCKHCLLAATLTMIGLYVYT
jgi:hypothetical protein